MKLYIIDIFQDFAFLHEPYISNMYNVNIAILKSIFFLYPTIHQERQGARK